MDAKEILKIHTSKLTALSEEEFDHFYSHFKPLSYKKGQAIITAGDHVNCEYFVLSGCLKSLGYIYRRSEISGYYRSPYSN